jgi:transposase
VSGILDRMSEPPAITISAEDWATTPPAVQAAFGQLLAYVTELSAEMGELRAKVSQNSQNSSKPPSSDPPSAPPRPKSTPRGRKAGGQPGHQGHSRPLVDQNDVQEIIPCRPTQCPSCQEPLAQTLPDVCRILRTQVWELPPIVPHITEYQQHTVCCPACGALAQGSRPTDAAPGGYGSRATALASFFHGRLRLSERETAAALLDICGLPISVGSVVRCCERTADALAPVYDTLASVQQQQKVINADETSWKEALKKAWLWVAVSTVATVFLLTLNRKRESLQRLVGADYAGILGSDRHTAYNGRDAALRQVCWAHLSRNLAALADYGHPDSAWASAMLDQVDTVFEQWYRYRNKQLDRAGLQAALLAVQQAIREGLEKGQQIGWHRISGLSRELLALWEGLWVFATTEGVEPTNNAAERALRPAVLWRKGCFGTRSAAGSRFVERMLTVSATCAQHERHLLTFLTEAIDAHWRGLPAPSLVPPAIP